MESHRHLRTSSAKSPRPSARGIPEGGHLRPDGSLLKALNHFALENNEHAIASLLLASTGAAGVLWYGSGDALLSSLIRGSVSRTTLDEEAFALIDYLQHHHGFHEAPEFPDVDIDESLIFDPAEPHPKWKKILPVIAQEVCLGGVLLFAHKEIPAQEADFDEYVSAITISFLIRQQQRRIDIATDRLNELSEAGKIFASVGEPERTMSRILELSLRASTAETGVIIDIDREGKLSATGMSLSTLSNIRFRSGQSLVERTLAVNDLLILRSDNLREELDPTSTNMVIDTLTAFTLKHEERTCGALLLINVPTALLSDSHFIAILGTVARLAASAITAEERQKDFLEQELTRQELSSAHAIQMSLLPKDVPSFHGLALAGMWKPSRTVGGDFYDILPLSPTRIGIIMADVSGKGIPAGMLMTIARSYFRVIAVDFVSSPSGALKRINRLICEEIADNKFITACYVILDAAKGTGRFSTAGHYPAVLVKPDGSAEPLAGSSGLPLGIFKDTDYTEEEFIFDPESILLMYTDGLVEARNSDAKIFGLRGLQDAVRGQNHLEPQVLLDLLWARTISHSVHAEPSDDWTAVAVKRMSG